jgi:hypothetical protein
MGFAAKRDLIVGPHASYRQRINPSEDGIAAATGLVVGLRNLSRKFLLN